MEKWYAAKHPECKFKPKEYFQAELDELFGKGEYTLLEPYYGSSSEVKIKHNKCGHITYTKGTRVLWQGKKCEKCYPPKNRKLLSYYDIWKY